MWTTAEFKIVEKTNKEEFVSEITFSLNQGWQLHGDFFIKEPKENLPFPETLYIQAMVKQRVWEESEPSGGWGMI